MNNLMKKNKFLAIFFLIYYILGILILTVGNYFIYQAGLGLAYGAMFVLGISKILNLDIEKM